MICFARRIQPVVEHKDYLISATGKVYSTKKFRGEQFRELKQSIGNHGYAVVNLTFPGSIQRVYTVHSLLCEAFGLYTFFEKEEQFYPEETRHRDGNKRNNHIGNLCPGTVSDNMKDRKVHDPMYLVGENHNTATITDEIVHKIREMHAKGVTTKDIAKEVGCSYSIAYSVSHNLSWKHL